MTDKYEGASKICTSCNNVITCRMTQYPNHPNKLQWQNDDGTAHFKFISDGIFECKVSQKSDSQKLEKPKAKDYKQCPMCRSNFGWFLKTETEKLKQHIKSYHSNSEILLPDDFKLGNPNSKIIAKLL